MSVESSKFDVERSGSGRAVFLSYASQDKDVAKRICDALRAAGVEVWFDQSELRGGDAWDGMIRKRIKECAMFIPVITPTTNARAEGYFRLEWKLAVDRSHLMADDAPFLFPIVVGDTDDATARVPDKFREVQWTRLRLDETPAELGARVARLLQPGAGSGEQGARTTQNLKPRTNNQRLGRWWMIFPIVGSIMGLMFAAAPMWKALNRPARPEPPGLDTPAGPATPAVSEARKLAERARELFDKIDSNADDFAVAESLLKRALELDATDGQIWAYSARLNAAYLTRSFERGSVRTENARNHAERAVKLAPESAEAWHALGRAIWRSDPPRAEQALRHALELAPDDGRILISLGSICRNMDRAEEALAFYVRAAAQPEVRPLALYDQFLIHLYLRRFEEADRCGREAATALPTTNSVTGVALLEIVWRGQVDAARRTLDAAPAAMRSEPRMVFASALAALMAKEPDAALSALDRLPGDYISDGWYSGPKALFTGLAHAQAARPEAARIAWESGLAILRRRLQDAPNEPELHLRLGELLAWTGETEAALREARVFEELARTRNDWTYSSARIYAALGRADDAVPILEKFLTATATGRWPLTPALLRLDPLWDKLRPNPRFAELITRTAGKAAGADKPVRAAVSPARELANQALHILEEIDVTREDLALASDRAEQAVKLDPSDGEAWAASSIASGAYIYRGWDTSAARREQSRVAAERAIRLAPKSINARLAQAGAWASFNINREETEKLLRGVLEEHPDHQATLRFLAVVVLGRGQLEEALALNERSAALPGGDSLALYNNGRYLLQAGRVDEAYAALERSLAQRPFSSALVMKTLLEIYQKGDLAAAEATQRRIPPAVLLEDRANYISGLLRYYRRDAEGALRTWGSFPRDAYMDFQFEGPKGILLGYAYELDGREAAAKIEWRTALQLADQRLAAAPNNPRRHYDRAHLLACLGEAAAASEALRTYEQLAGIKLGPGVPMSFELALVYARLGRLDELFAHWPPPPNTRIRLDPRFDKVRADPRFETLAKAPAPKK